MGELLAAAGSADVVDAVVVLLAARHGDIIVTSDPDDLGQLAAALGVRLALRPITVTERGRPKAVLGPLPGGDNLARDSAEGWITPPRSPGPVPAPPARARASVSVRDMVDEDRVEE